MATAVLVKQQWVQAMADGKLLERRRWRCGVNIYRIPPFSRYQLQELIMYCTAFDSIDTFSVQLSILDCIVVKNVVVGEERSGPGSARRTFDLAVLN